MGLLDISHCRDGAYVEVGDRIFKDIGGVEEKDNIPVRLEVDTAATHDVNKAGASVSICFSGGKSLVDLIGVFVRVFPGSAIVDTKYLDLVAAGLG